MNNEVQGRVSQERDFILVDRLHDSESGLGSSQQLGDAVLTSPYRTNQDRCRNLAKVYIF